MLLFSTLVVLQTSNYWRTLFEVTDRDTILLYGLLTLNFFAFIVFGFILLRSILKLARERRALQLGAKIRTRLFVYFTAISILPIVAMAFFSYLFMNRALDRWFTKVPESVIVEARDLQAASQRERSERYRAEVRLAAMALGSGSVGERELGQIVSAGGLQAAAVVDNDNAIVSHAARPGSAIEMSNVIGPGVETYTAPLADGRRLMIVPEPSSETSVTTAIDSSIAEYENLRQQQGSVRQIGLLTLGVLAFLLIFASSWTAFHVARGLTAPIKALAEGAGEVAKGNLGYKVDAIAEDELEILVNAFNQMSAKLEENAEELARRRRYIETVLQSLPTGVMSVDAEARITTINTAAKEMLRIENVEADFDMAAVVSPDIAAVLERVSSRARRIGHASEQASINVDRESQLSASVTATALPEDAGVVFVIEDLSDLIAAQRASAWREVARRMAHEIKNPLTPIQLSAERIRKRVLAEPEAVAAGLQAAGFDVQPSYSSDVTANVIRDGTDTIIREVQSLKAMVDEFSLFARLPNARLEPGDVDEVLSQAVDLYRDRAAEAIVEDMLSGDLPQAMIDREQLKRVIVNLIDNAIEAPAFNDQQKRIVVRSRHDVARDLIVTEVADNGSGIDPADFQRLFQPYFSTKGRETGLGLAIVHRIISEHNGKIKAVANHPHGAKFIIELPAAG